MTPNTFAKRSRGRAFASLLLVALIPLLQGCASVGPVADDSKIIAEIISVPAGIEMTYRGRVVGMAPLEVPIDALYSVVDLGTTVEQPPIIERRVRVLAPERVEVTIRIGSEPTPVAQALGLAQVVVFDYGALATFDVDQYTLKAEVLPLLQRQAEVLQDHFGDLDIYVCGHTDSTGTGDHNQVLAVNRAQAVADYLVSQGLSKERLNVQGFGADFPLADNATREGRKLNRRTEIVLAGS